MSRKKKKDGPVVETEHAFGPARKVGADPYDDADEVGLWSNENAGAINPDGSVSVNQPGQKEAISREFAQKGSAQRRAQNARTIDGRAFFDGRLPADYTSSGEYAIPDNCLAYHPDSHYFADSASFQLCSCEHKSMPPWRPY